MKFKVGDLVEKSGGDYYFSGHILSIFKKRSGVERCVVENKDGMLFIFNEGQLKLLAVKKKVDNLPRSKNVFSDDY